MLFVQIVFLLTALPDVAYFPVGGFAYIFDFTQ